MDILASNIEKEQDLKSWLEQLNENVKSEEVQDTINRQHVKTNSRFEFDTILGELDDLEKQFEVENSTEGLQPPPPQPLRTISTPNPPPPSVATSSTDLSKSNPPNMSRALEEFSLINSQLEDVLNDLAGFVGKPPEPVKCPPLSTRAKPPPPPVPSKGQTIKTLHSVEADTKQTPRNDSSASSPKIGNGTLATPDVKRVDRSNDFQQQRQQSDNSNKPAESPIIQSCVSVQLADDSMMGFCVTSVTTVRDLYKSILSEVIKCNQKYFTLWEVLPDLSMERELEAEQFVLSDMVDHWSKHSNNKILMKFTKLPISPPPNLKGELKGTLHVKTDDKKSWKGFTFLMQPTGLFYYPKGKGKLEASCYLELPGEARSEVFFGIGWKKKLKAPSEFGFALKPLKVQTDSDKDVKYFCTDTEALRIIWTSALKELMKKKTSETSQEVHPNSMKIETPPVFDDSNHYSEPFETHPNNHHSRRISNASSCSGRMEAEEGVVTPAAKKFANLPITTETTRYLQSMQATLPQRQPSTMTKPLAIEDYSRPTVQKDQLLVDKNQKNQTCLNEYTPSPFACKTPELILKSQPKPNLIKTLPKPNKSLCQQAPTTQMLCDLDLPPPPPSMMAQQYQTLPSSSAKSRTFPPPPPKRDHSTRLSSKPAEAQATSVQTRNFILNLDRTIGQKRAYGAEGLGRVEMPLPPPPMATEEISYLDLGELPPPPADLLQGLKCMRTNPGLFQSIRRWP